MKNLSQFGELLDRLVPGLSLHADNLILKSLFQPSGSIGIDGLTVQAAQETAAEHDCTFLYEDECGVFVRAYSK